MREKVVIFAESIYVISPHLHDEKFAVVLQSMRYYHVVLYVLLLFGHRKIVVVSLCTDNMRPFSRFFIILTQTLQLRAN